MQLDLPNLKIDDVEMLMRAVATAYHAMRDRPGSVATFKLINGGMDITVTQQGVIAPGMVDVLSLRTGTDIRYAEPDALEVIGQTIILRPFSITDPA